jgi:hypothetical protein
VPELIAARDRVEVLALEVLDELVEGRTRPLADDAGHLRELRDPGGAPAALAGDDGVLPDLAPGRHEDRLQDPALADAGGEPLKTGLVEPLSALRRIGLQLVDRDEDHRRRGAR